MRALRLSLAVGLAGCVNGFTGSNVQIDFSPATPAQAPAGATPKSTELPTNIHFLLYAFQNGSDASGNPVGRLFEVRRFEIHKIVDPTSPCFIDVGPHVPHPGLHVSQYAKVIGADNGIDPNNLANPPPGATPQQQIDVATAVQRMANVTALAGDSGMKAVTSASQATYPAVAADCAGAPDQLPPPTCTDDAANARRLALCQAAWRADPNLWEGTDRVLTAPLGGTTFGMVDGLNPVNLGPVGGAQLFVDDALVGFDGYAVYWQFDDTDGDGQPDYPASFPVAQRSTAGQLLVFGTPTMPTRGVTHVHLKSPSSPLVVADMAIFAGLGDDNTQF